MERKRFGVACPLTTCRGKPLLMVPSRKQGYDAIVVGAGLSGATLAYRLATRDPPVLVLERGDFLRLPPRRAGEPIVGIHIRSATARPSLVLLPTMISNPTIAKQLSPHNTRGGARMCRYAHPGARSPRRSWLRPSL